MPTIKFNKHKAKLLINGKYHKIKTITITEHKIMISYGEDITPSDQLFISTNTELVAELTADEEVN